MMYSLAFLLHDTAAMAPQTARIGIRDCSGRLVSKLLPRYLRQPILNQRHGPDVFLAWGVQQKALAVGHNVVRRT